MALLKRVADGSADIYDQAHRNADGCAGKIYRKGNCMTVERWRHRTTALRTVAVGLRR